MKDVLRKRKKQLELQPALMTKQHQLHLLKINSLNRK